MNVTSLIPRRGIMRAFVGVGILLVFTALISTVNKSTSPWMGNKETSLLQSIKTNFAAEKPSEAFEKHSPLFSNDVADITQVDIKFPMDLDGQRAQRVNPYAEMLQPDLVPPNVHMMWCGERWFEFKHYLTIQSVYRTVKPDKVVLHYERKPTIDKMFYNLWLEDLKHDNPFFIMKQMSDRQKKFCSGSDEDRLSIIIETLSEAGEGGMFVGENTWMVELQAVERRVDLTMALETGNSEGYFILRGGVLNVNVTYNMVMGNDKFRTSRASCSQVHHVYEGNLTPKCMIVKGGNFNYFTPMDIWELNDPFGKLSRRIFYGTEEIRHPIPSYDELVPNIGHMVWIGGGPMDFVFYLSLLSMLYVVEVDVVYIHGDKEPAGDLWQKVKNNPKLSDRVKYIYRSPPYSLYQGVIEPWYRALMSDVIRVDLMIKYGGVYTDTDAIWVKPLTQEDRGYDAVASYDWVDWSWPFPDSVNFGLSYGKRNAPFWQIFRDSMRTLHNDVHGFTGVMMPYKLLEKYPHLLRIDRRLQVICYEQKCHPLWVEDYHNMTKDHVAMNSIKNWREDVNAFHWTHPNPPEYKDEETLKRSTGMFAEIGQFVLKKAGLL